MDKITYDDFAKLDIRIAKIIKIEEIEGADKLLKLTLDVGDPENGGLGERTIAAGIKQFYSPDKLVGKLVPYLSNLEPKELRGVVSQGMLLAAINPPSHKASEGQGGRPYLLRPDHKVKPGSKVR